MLLQAAEEMEGDEGEFSARSEDQQVQIPTRHVIITILLQLALYLQS